MKCPYSSALGGKEGGEKARRKAALPSIRLASAAQARQKGECMKFFSRALQEKRGEGGRGKDTNPSEEKGESSRHLLSYHVLSKKRKRRQERHFNYVFLRRKKKGKREKAGLLESG